MAQRINPFRPNSPVPPGIFVGRIREIETLEMALRQTRAGQPKNFMVTGERGIGKTSLLDYIRFVARGDIALDDGTLTFLVLASDVGPATTKLGLVRKIQRALERELAKTEQARAFLKEAWAFLQRVETKVIRIRESEEADDPETMLDDFAYSLAQTTIRLSSKEDSGTIFSARYDGVLLLLDECDNASKELDLGSFLKLLLERVQRNGCDHFMVGIAGLQNLRDVLHESHPSSLRLFDGTHLERLTHEEVATVVDICLRKANEENTQKTTIDPGARHFLVGLSEGFPHFIQQLGYCAFAEDTDGVISTDDVMNGALGSDGAISRIGDRYYRDDFYNKIQKDSYRQVLRIMADRLDEWMSKDEIRSKFRGNETTLGNALHALRTRKIIVSREGSRGVYRLRNKAFAMWIKLYTAPLDNLQ
jgi:Cdc6-like AAA superfamily ATPase